MDVETGSIVANWEAHQSWVKASLFTPDGDTLITAGHDHKVAEWDVSAPTNPREKSRVTAHVDSILAASLSADGTKLLTGSRDGSARLWSRPVNPESETLHTTDSRVSALALSIDENHLAFATPRNLHIYDFPGRRGLETFMRDGRIGYSGVAFSPDGRWLAAASAKLRMWDLRNPSRLPRTVNGPSGEVDRVAFHPTLPWIATNESNQHIGAWDVLTAAPRGTFTVPKSLAPYNHGFGAFAFSADGAYLAAVGTGYHNRAVLWRTSDGSIEQCWEEKSPIAFTPSGREIATVGNEHTIHILDVETGAETHRLLGHTKGVNGIAFSPDGRLAASTAIEGPIKIWSLVSDKALMQLGGKHIGYRWPVFAAKGRKLIVVGLNEDGTNEVLVFSAEPPSGRVVQAE
jgi:WD40 repeat protein